MKDLYDLSDLEKSEIGELPKPANEPEQSSASLLTLWFKRTWGDSVYPLISDFS